MAPRRQNDREGYLLKMLAAVFIFQITLFSFAVVKCSRYDAPDLAQACPNLGRRYDQTFGVMIATILALLGASRPKNDL